MMKRFLEVLRQYAGFGGKVRRRKELARTVAFFTVSFMTVFSVKASGYSAGNAAGEAAVVGLIVGLTGLVSLVILTLMCVKNAKNAGKRNKNRLWAVVYTVLLALLGLFVGASIYVVTGATAIILAGILCWGFALLGGGIAFLIARPSPEESATQETSTAMASGALSERSGGMKASVVVDKPVEDVWNYFTDISRWTEWHGGEILSADWENGGYVTWKLGGASQITVCEFQKTITLRGAWMDTSYHFTEQGKSTLFSIKEGSPKGSASWNDGGVAHLNQLKDSLNKFKKGVESL